MGRKPKPWFRKQTKTWYVNIDGKQINLGKDKKIANQKFHELMVSGPPTIAPPFSIVELLDRFLIWSNQNRSSETFKWYSKRLQSFLDSLPIQTMSADELRPFHIEAWIALKPTWSHSMKRGAMGAVQRAYIWAHRQGLVESLPLATLEKPSAERRDNCPTDADFKAMLEHTKDENFKDVLNFLWETGCRPQEMRIAETRHFQNGRIELPAKESKGKKRPRIIYLNSTAKEIVEKRLGDGLIFTNRNGNPWTAFAINCRMRRIAEKTGKHFAAYDLRHGFATRMLLAGVDHISAAEIMGHKDTSMISRVYSHIGNHTNHLEQQLLKMNDSKSA